MVLALRRLLARVIADLAEPRCRGGCRQPISRCTCDPRWRLL